MSTLRHQTIIHYLALTIDNNYLVTGDENGHCHIWQISSSSFLETLHLKPHTKQVSTLLITPDQKYIITASYDNTYCLTEIKTSYSTTPITAHTNEITTAHITSESNKLITTSHSGEIKIWDLDTQKLLASFFSHQDSIYTAAITPDNKKLITGSADTTCRFWDIAVSDRTSLQPEKTEKYQLTANKVIITNAKISDSNRKLLLYKYKGEHLTTSAFISAIDYKDYYTRTLSCLLRYIGSGMQEQAEQILNNDPSLALQKDTLIDCTLYKYRNISALQYAVWALDYHMWKMIFEHIERANLQQKAWDQLEELNHIAILKEEGWVIISEHNVDWPSLSWSPLIRALDEYLKNYDGNIWRQQVGGAQLMLPAHVIHEYSHPSRLFYPCPMWGDKEDALPRTSFTNWRVPRTDARDVRDIYDDNYILGINFAWFRGGGRLNAAPHTATKDNINRVFTAVTGIWEIGGWERADRAALSELLRVRVEQVRTMLEKKPLSKPNNSTRFSL